MEEINSKRIETKFVNARTVEGKPQTERLKYFRELFEAFGEKDKRFSGAVVLGSTVKGYGLEEDSDIDVALCYYERPKRKWGQGIEVFGTPGPVGWREVYTFTGDFDNFKKEFELKKKEKDEKTFEIDRNPGGTALRDSFKINFFGKTSISIENMLLNVNMFFELSYPIIGTKNKRALMPMEKVLTAMRKAVAEASAEQKAELLKEIIDLATYFIDGEFKKYSARMNFTITKEQYFELRIQTLKQRLKSKFGLAV